MQAITGESANTATEDTSVASTSSSSTTTPRMQVKSKLSYFDLPYPLK